VAIAQAAANAFATGHGVAIAQAAANAFAAGNTGAAVALAQVRRFSHLLSSSPDLPTAVCLYPLSALPCSALPCQSTASLADQRMTDSRPR
jgi:hypothetical protein